MEWVMIHRGKVSVGNTIEMSRFEYLFVCPSVASWSWLLLSCDCYIYLHYRKQQTLHYRVECDFWMQPICSGSTASKTSKSTMYSANEWILQFVLNLLRETCSTWLGLTIFLTGFFLPLSLFVCFFLSSKHFITVTHDTLELFSLPKLHRHPERMQRRVIQLHPISFLF